MNVACAHGGMPLETGHMSEWTRSFDKAKESSYLSRKPANPLALHVAAPRPVVVGATSSGAGLARGAARVQEDTP
jgi:hypothetical protein